MYIIDYIVVLSFYFDIWHQIEWKINFGPYQCEKGLCLIDKDNEAKNYHTYYDLTNWYDQLI